MDKFAIIGGGNGGQCIGAYLKLSGKTVAMYEAFDKVRNQLLERGGINLKGASLNGFAKLDLISDDLGKVISGSQVIFVVLPAFTHVDMATKMAPYLEDGQTLILCPGSTCGALEVRRVLDACGCKANIRLAETSSLFYAARASEAGAEIYAVKEKLYISALPATETQGVVDDLADVYPQLVVAKNVLETGMSNMNAIVHALPILMNTGRIECGLAYRHYADGITPSVARAVEKMDMERMAVAEALGLSTITLGESYQVYYNHYREDYCEMIRTSEAHIAIMAPTTLDSRLITEDIPMGTIPMAELGKLAGVPTPVMDATIALASAAIGYDLREKARTLESLGLEGKTKEELLAYINA